MFKNIRRRLTLFYTLLMTMFVILLVIGAHESMEWSIKSEQEHEVLSFAEEEAHEHALLLQHRDILLEKKTADDFPQGSGRMYFYAFDTAGRLINATRMPPEVEPEILRQIKNQEFPEDEPVVIRRNIRDDGKIRHKIMMTAMPIIVNGEKAGTVYVGRDVSSVLKGLEKATLLMGGFALLALFLASGAGYIMAGRAIIPLKQAYDKQRQFAADVSHELRTPLSIIMTSIDVLQNDSAAASPFLKQIMTDMKDEIKKMADLVGNLLTLSLSEQSGAPLLKEPFNLTVAAEQMMRKMQPLADKKNIQIFLSGKHTVELCADMTKVKQLLMILIDNAVKYTPDNGMITLKLEKIMKKNTVRIVVQDTGIGIPAEEREKIFERFYRVDKSRSRALGGSGLGLAIAYSIVCAHHGRISIESHPGQGSAFIAEFPS